MGISELNNVKYISIDMYEPYRDIAHIFFNYLSRFRYPLLLSVVLVFALNFFVVVFLSIYVQ